MKKNNIYLRLCGGLGNQLYQFSYALYLMKRLGYKKIVLDISNFDKYRENWGFLLFEVINRETVNSFVSVGRTPILDLRIPKFISYIKTISKYFGMYSDKNCNDVLSIIRPPKNLYLDGYFENFCEKKTYFKLTKALIRDDLKIDLDERVVVVNVRGGELARLKVSKLDDVNFYLKIMHDLSNTYDNLEFHLVTDDIIYARALFKNKGVTFIEHQPDCFENFSLIYSAKYKILSRSTFSKWAGFLSKDRSEVYGLSDF